MAAGVWLYVIDTSPRADYAWCVLATLLVGGVAVWAALEAGWNPGTAVLLSLTLILAATAAYARHLWRRPRADLESRRLRAANRRAFR